MELTMFMKRYRKTRKGKANKNEIKVSSNQKHDICQYENSPTRIMPILFLKKNLLSKNTK